MTKKWPKHKEEIIKLYLEQNKPLHQVKELMLKNHGFDASVRAYRSTFDKWGVTKYKCQRRRNSTTTVASTISSPPGDEFYGNPAYSPTGAHPPMLARLYSSPDLGQVGSEDFMGMEHSHITLALNSRPSQAMYLPLDPEIQSPADSISSASPRSAFNPLGFYNAAPGHSYDNGNTTGGNIHTPLQLSGASEHPPHMLSWRNDASNLDCHGSTRLHDALKSPCWWLSRSTVAVIREELSYADVNQQNSYGETPMSLILRCLQAPLHPEQVNVLFQLLQAPNITMRCQFQEHFSPLGIIFERALDSANYLAVNENMATTVCNCLCRLLDLGIDPNILVRDKPVVHHFLQDPDRMMSYTTFWPLLEALCKSTAPNIYDDNLRNAALHCAVSTRAVTRNTTDVVLARTRSAISVLLDRSRKHGSLNSRNAQGRTALQLLVERWTADADDDEFWWIARDLVLAGADTTQCGLVPEDFAARLHKLARSRPSSLPVALQQLLDGMTPLPAVLWLSACEQRSKEAVQEHFVALELCRGGLGVDISVLKSLLRSH